jgi:hypothetical protein
MNRRCIVCAKTLPPEAGFCPRCGVAVAAAPASREEKSYFDAGDITVTSARIRVGRTTYSIADVRSFRLDERTNAAATLCGVLLLTAVAMLIYSVCQQQINWWELLLAIVIMGAGVAAGAAAASFYDLVLTTGSGRVTAYSTMNRKLAWQIGGAITTAVAERTANRGS